LAAFLLDVGIVRRRQHGLGRHLPEIKAHDRRRPLGHIELRGRLREPARHAAALAREVEPERLVGILGIELARPIEIRQRLGQRVSDKIEATADEVRQRIVRIEPDRLVEIREGAVVLALEEVRGATVAVGQC
jgi:hypothetical protein